MILLLILFIFFCPIGIVIFFPKILLVSICYFLDNMLSIEIWLDDFSAINSRLRENQ